MDALYVFRHSALNDIEIRCSLRSIERYMPWVRKVWIFGDRPVFLSDDTSVVEHVPHKYVARAGNFRTPVTNFFHLLFLGSLIPELDFEFLWFCDDFILLRQFREAEARKNRCLGDLGQVKDRGKGLWKESLWRTYDLLRRLGYPGYNFEVHVPTYLTKKRVFDAWCDFKDFTTQDRWYGMLGPTAILNHALKHERFELTHLDDEGTRAGIWGRPPSYDEVVKTSQGKLFLNFDDEAFGDGLRRFLVAQFPSKSVYEKTDVDEDVWSAADSGETKIPQAPWYPAVIMPNRDSFGEFLNRQGLDGEGVEVGVSRGEFSATLLKTWHGKRLHCVEPWAAMTEDTKYLDVANVSQAEHEKAYCDAQRRLSVFGDRCLIHRMTSKAAAAQFPERSLDFVYLDARHYREAVLEDLELWAPKMRAGGFLAGHDYLDGTLPSGRFEVKSAVDWWAAQHGLTPTCSGEHVWRSWFIQCQHAAGVR